MSAPTHLCLVLAHLALHLFPLCDHHLSTGRPSHCSAAGGTVCPSARPSPACSHHRRPEGGGDSSEQDGQACPQRVQTVPQGWQAVTTNFWELGGAGREGWGWGVWGLRDSITPFLRGSEGRGGRQVQVHRRCSVNELGELVRAEPTLPRTAPGPRAGREGTWGGRSGGVTSLIEVNASCAAP